MNQPASDRSTPQWLFPAILGAIVVAAIVIALIAAGGDDSEPGGAEPVADGSALNPEDQPPSDGGEEPPAGGEGQVSGSEVGPVALLGEPLPEFGGDPSNDAAVGTAAPGFEGSDFDGTAHTIDPADGTGRMIGFFTHWCSHCQREVPTVVNWIAGGNLPDGVEVVAVSTAVDQGAPNYPPSAWFAREGFEELVLRDDQIATLGSGFGLSGFPYWVVVDGDGNVVARASGEQTSDQLSQLAALAAG